MSQDDGIIIYRENKAAKSSRRGKAQSKMSVELCKNAFE
jgi:hypothetical protein